MQDRLVSWQLSSWLGCLVHGYPWARLPGFNAPLVALTYLLRARVLLCPGQMLMSAQQIECPGYAIAPAPAPATRPRHNSEAANWAMMDVVRTH